MIPMKQMDEFIRYYASLYSQNPNLPITSDTTYDALRNYGLTANEINNSSIEDQINTLENNFSKSKHLYVYVDTRQPGFLQFRHWVKDDMKCIKLYMSVPKEYVGYASQRIFDFIDKNRMASASKVAKKVRSDVIVLRLASDHDAKKVLNFINKDKALTSIARDTNPFSLKEGVVGIGYDEMLSYNSVVSEYMSDYFNELRGKQCLQNASISDFSNYLSQCHQDIFVNCSKLIDFTRKKSFQSSLKRFDNSVGHAIVNYEQVTRLLNAVCKGQIDLKSYFGFYNNCDDKKKQKKLIDQYDDIYKMKAQEHQQNQVVDREILSSSKQVLDEYILYAFKKYGSINNVIERIRRFLTGETLVITRDCNFRNKFINIKQNIFPIIGNINNIDNYVSSLVNISNENNNSYAESMTERYGLLFDASVETLKKYGYQQLEKALSEATKGNYMYITNGNGNYRNRIKQSINPQDIEKYCAIYLTERGYNLDGINIFETYTQDINTYVTEKMQTYQ